MNDVSDRGTPETGSTPWWSTGGRDALTARLRQGLKVLGLPSRDVNIWADPSAAAAVRKLAGGNETVPTVVIGDREFVNPPASTVLAEVRRVVPGFTLDAELARSGRRIRMLRWVQWVLIAATVAASFALDGTGHSVLSWALDVVAVAVYGAFRLAARTVRP